MLDDGRVIYTRWDYNDRSQMFPQALFQMNPDGTGQTEFYGNNSWFPTTIAHARGIPARKASSASSAATTLPQAGKLGILDPAKGRQENARRATRSRPCAHTPAERIDYYGQTGELFQYPYPLTETEFLVAYAPLGLGAGRRRKEAGALTSASTGWTSTAGASCWRSDPDVPCQQPVPLMPRAPPPVRPSLVDYRQNYRHLLHAGRLCRPGLAGVPRGTVKKLRVVALEFRAAGVGNNGSIGPGGEALVCTPIAIGNGSWDVKIVLGDATVHEDGSAFFTVPARDAGLFPGAR